MNMWLGFGAVAAMAWLLRLIQVANQLGSYRMVVDLLEMRANMMGNDRVWNVRPDEKSCKRLLWTFALGIFLLGPFGLFIVIAGLRDD